MQLNVYRIFEKGRRKNMSVTGIKKKEKFIEKEKIFVLCIEKKRKEKKVSFNLLAISLKDFARKFLANRFN